MIKVFEIEGHSLYPFFKNGQRVLCKKVYKKTKLEIGDFVVFCKKGYPQMIKRIKLIENGKFFLQGTSTDSVDSRDFGFVEKHEIYFKTI